MSNKTFKMQFTEPDEDLVLTVIDQILEIVPSVANKYSVLAKIMRQDYKININSAKVKEILLAEEALKPIEAVPSRKQDRESLSKILERSNLKEIKEEEEEKAPFHACEYPFREEFDEGIDERFTNAYVDSRAGFKQDEDFVKTPEEEEFDMSLDGDDPDFWEKVLAGDVQDSYATPAEAVNRFTNKKPDRTPINRWDTIENADAMASDTL